MLKNRILKLEQVNKQKMWIPPRQVIQEEDGSWVTNDGVKITENGEKFLFEDGSIYYESKEEYSHFVQLVRIMYA